MVYGSYAYAVMPNKDWHLFICKFYTWIKMKAKWRNHVWNYSIDVNEIWYCGGTLKLSGKFNIGPMLIVRPNLHEIEIMLQFFSEMACHMKIDT